MNSLVVTTDSKSYRMMEIREKNRRKYPKAYNRLGGFSLGEYLYCYCLDDYQGGQLPEWAESFAEGQSALSPREVENHGFYGFFGMPEPVQEGILICIHEYFFPEPGYYTSFSEFSDELHLSACSIVEKYIEYLEEIRVIANPEEREEKISDELTSWIDYMYYNCIKFGYFRSEEEIIFVSQLAAYMGYSVYIPSVDLYSEESFSHPIFEAMVFWENLRKIEFPSDESGPVAGVSILLNSDQGMLSGNRDLADYLEDMFNMAAKGGPLRGLMEKYEEYFPLKDHKIRVDAYAEI